MKKAIVYELKDYKEQRDKKETTSQPDIEVSSLFTWVEQVKFEK